ncbi:hypothetical protein ACWDSJ_04900 [Nocardia sp. NPDC003482]
MHRMSARDATRYWLSRRMGNDLFLLYCFDETGLPTAELRAWVLERAARIPDLRVRVRERRFAFPEWAPRAVTDDQVVEHAAGPGWADLVAVLENVVGETLRADERAWRLHLMREVRDAPRGSQPATLAVLQLSHALADGRRAAAIARELFSASPPAGIDPGSASGLRPSLLSWFKDVATESISLAILPIDLGRTMFRGLAAERSRRELAELTARGAIPAPAAQVPPTPLNRGPAPRAHAVRMLVRDDLRIPGHTVTVTVLTAVGPALARYLGTGDALAAQVPMASPEPDGEARNNYRDLAVELEAGEPDPRRRAELIAATLARRRARALHPLLTAPDRVTDVIPAPILRRDVATYPLDAVPETLGAHTVVSSVYRGPADLALAGGAVRFTAGFPAIGSVMHLTHGVHGLGDTVTVSVHADPAVVDADRYAALLADSLTEVVAALRD